jgi:hypothetical protein
LNWILSEELLQIFGPERRDADERHEADWLGKETSVRQIGEFQGQATDGGHGG